MIDFKSDNGKVSLTMEGDLAMICTDASMLLSAIYKQLAGKDLVLALTFRYAIAKNVADGTPFDLVDFFEAEAKTELRELVKKIFKEGK